MSWEDHNQALSGQKMTRTLTRHVWNMKMWVGIALLSLRMCREVIMANTRLLQPIPVELSLLQPELRLWVSKLLLYPERFVMESLL